MPEPQSQRRPETEQADNAAPTTNPRSYHEQRTSEQAELQAGRERRAFWNRECQQADAALADLRVNGCSWWSLALALVAGAGVGQVLLMAALVLLAGGDAGARDEHEEDF